VKQYLRPIQIIPNLSGIGRDKSLASNGTR
jgi:hypothetical protein